MTERYRFVQFTALLLRTRCSDCTDWADYQLTTVTTSGIERYRIVCESCLDEVLARHEDRYMGSRS